MPDPTTYHFELSGNRPRRFPLNEYDYPGIQNVWPNRSSARIFDPVNGIRGIVIHATAGSSSAGAVATMRNRRVSFHWLVPDENEPQHGAFVWKIVPEARAAWHVRNQASHPDVNGGAQRVNHWSLGIEIVNSQTPSDSFSNWQIQATAQIVRYAWAQYPNLKHVVSHAKLDPRRRSDPGIQFPWGQFRNAVFDSSLDPAPPSIALAAPSKCPENPHEGVRGCCLG